MYNVPKHTLPEGETYASYIDKLMMNIENGDEVEHNQTLLFELTYPFAMIEVHKYRNVDDVQELTPDMSVAFIKSLNNFNRKAENASFLNLYKTSIRNEIIMHHYKFRNTDYKMSYKEMANTNMSLDKPRVDPKGNETEPFGSIIEDESINMDESIDYESLVDAIHVGIDKIFGHYKDTEKHRRVKEIYLEYTDGIITGKRIRQVDIAVKYGISQSYVTRIIERHNKRLAVVLKNQGYDI